jgi:hypothetical protein
MGQNQVYWFNSVSDKNSYEDKTVKLVDRYEESILFCEPFVSWSYLKILKWGSKMEVIDEFRIEPFKVFGLTNVVFEILNSVPVARYSRIKNIPYIIVPRAAKFFDHFERTVFDSLPKGEDRIVGLSDFGNFEIRKTLNANDTGIAILNIGKGDTAFGVQIGSDMDKVVGRSSTFSLSHDREKKYCYVVENLPFNVEDKSDEKKRREFIENAIYVIANSIATLTLIYTFFNFDWKVQKVEGFSGHSEKSVEYISAIVGKFKKLGNDFHEVIKRLIAISYLL